MSAPVYASKMTPQEVRRYVESLPQVKRKGTEARPAWYVEDRLVARLDDPNTLVIRVPLSRRESLLESYPETFGVRLAWRRITRSWHISIVRSLVQSTRPSTLHGRCNVVESS